MRVTFPYPVELEGPYLYFDAHIAADFEESSGGWDDPGGSSFDIEDVELDDDEHRFTPGELTRIVLWMESLQPNDDLRERAADAYYEDIREGYDPY